MDYSMRGLPVHHQLPEFTQTHVHWVSDAIQPTHSLSSPSPFAFSLSQHRGLFKWASSSHQIAASPVTLQNPTDRRAWWALESQTVGHHWSNLTHTPFSCERAREVSHLTSESEQLVYFANPQRVNRNHHFPLGSKTFPFTHLESSDYSLLSQKLQAGWVEHIICKLNLPRRKGWGALRNAATGLFNTEQCHLSTRDDLKRLCRAQCPVPTAWLQLSFYHLPRTLTKTAVWILSGSIKEEASDKLGKIHDRRQRNGNLVEIWITCPWAIYYYLTKHTTHTHIVLLKANLLVNVQLSYLVMEKAGNNGQIDQLF